jgi:hypothetical protein
MRLSIDGRELGRVVEARQLWPGAIDSGQKIRVGVRWISTFIVFSIPLGLLSHRMRERDQ